MIYLQLFISFLQIGAFSFGGGYAALPLIQDQVITAHHWLDIGEFTDLITISQMTPGPISINAATFVGLKVAGLPGAVSATIGCILPSCLIVTVIAWFYLKYRQMSVLQGVLETLRPAVVALIAAAGVAILRTALWGEEAVISLDNLKIPAAGIFLAALVLLRYKKLNPILVMLLAGAIQVVLQLL